MFEVGKLVARIALEGAETFKKDVKSIGDEFTGLSDKGKKASTEVGAGLTVLGGSILALTGLAIAKFADFDKSMSAVKAASGATGAELESLRSVALEMGADTKYSATEAADGIVQLSKAGVGANDIIGGGLAGSLALAAAGEIAVGDAAETAATAMTQFKLSGDQIPHLADLLAAGAGKAQGGVQDLSMALKQGGLVAAQMGLSVDETVGTLTAFAAAGLLGSDAGTSLKTMLLALVNPSTKAAEAMKTYNINAYDSEGHFVSMQDLAGQLQAQLGGLDEATRNAALATIFGSDAIRAASVLYNEGAAGIGEWNAAVDDSGYAARQAAELQNNLAGDVEKLGGAFDTALVQTGAGANDVLRQMVQLVTAAVDVYSGLPEPIQQGTLWVGLFAGGLALVAGALLIGIPKVIDFRNSLKTLRDEMPVTTSRLKGIASFLTGPWGVALSIGALALGSFVAGQLDASRKAQTYGSSLDEATGSVTDFTKEIIASNLATKGGWGPFQDTESASEAASKLGIDLDTLTDAITGNADAIDIINQKTFDPSNIFGDEGDLRAQADAVGLATDEYSTASRIVLGALESEGTAVNTAKDAHVKKAEATEEDAAASMTAADAYTTQAQTGQTLLDTLDSLLDTILEMNGIGQDAVSTNATYQASLQGVRDTIQKVQEGAEGYSNSLDENTVAGSANADMFRGLAGDSQKAAEAQYNLDQKTMSAKDATDKYVSALQGGRQELYNQIYALTGNADAAQALTDKIYAIPDEHQTQILAETAEGIQRAQAFIDMVNSVPEYRRTVIGVTVENRGQELFGTGINQARGGIVHYYAQGGVENHVAQIAAAGTTRVWNEPETGGELYAPLAESKRSRTMSVIGSQLAEWGYDIVPAGSQGKGAEKASSLSGLRISGTLDMGGGLSGYVEGVVLSALDDADDEAKRGAR